MTDLSDLARAVLLAFADLGIYLPSNRERIIRKIRGLDPLDPDDLEQFLDLCIEADLIAPEDRGRLRLAPTEAQKLAASLDGPTPGPDGQGNARAQLLPGAAA